MIAPWPKPAAAFPKEDETMSFAVLTDTSGNLPKRLTDENNIGKEICNHQINF